MKNHRSALPVFLAATLLCATIGCGDDRPKNTALNARPALAFAPVPVEVATPVDPFVPMAEALDSTTRDQTASLAGTQAALNREIDAQIATWKSQGNTSRPVLEEKLALARTDFTQKMAALSWADEITWRNTKGTARASLQNLRRVFAEYLTGTGVTPNA